MISFFLYSAVVLTLVISLSLIRVVQGPTVFDRLMGANAIATKTIGLICLIGYVFGRMDMFVDITLAYAILGFIGVVAVAKFVHAEEDSEE